MNHETFEELLALRLYDELDEGEARALDAHLESCEACRGLSLRLEEGLGAVPRTVPEDLPSEWRDDLERDIRISVEPRRVPILAFACGLAAGVLAAFFLQFANGSPATIEPSAPAFARAAPPPQTTTRGPLVRLENLRRNG